MPTSFFNFMLPLLDNPILIAVYIILITAIINLITAKINNSFQKEREQVSQLEDIYAGCIKSLATVSTLSGATEENLDNIEKSLIEAKKYLSLLLMRTKERSYIYKIEKEAYLFATGDYKKLLEVASRNELTSSKYNDLLDERRKQCLSAADIMLQIMIKNAHQDKRLLQHFAYK